MKSQRLILACSVVFAVVSIVACQSVPDEAVTRLNPQDFKQWLLPAEPPSPTDNKPTVARVELGKMLFFDPRMSRDGTTSCASCHSPMLGWSDGLPFGIGFHGKPMARSSPTIVNTGYNTIQMWDGRRKELEDMAMIPLQAGGVMNTDIEKFFKWINTTPAYKQAFANAYPGEPIDAKTLSKALSAYERTIVSRNSPFDRWIEGDKNAMTKQQLRGLEIFVDKNKGNCAVCHSAPNFTDNGFHNLGLKQFGSEKPDVGRYAHVKVASMQGAFKTPTLREIEYTAPYFHDGSAKTLMDVVEHYNKGGEVKTNLSTNIKPLNLTQAEKEDLVAFMKALSSKREPVVFPELPQE